VSNVLRCAVGNAACVAGFHTGDCDEFVDWVNAAALYHDLGKLDKANQELLACDSSRRPLPLPIAHQDAGVAELDRLRRQESVVLVAAHHDPGLFSMKTEMGKQGRPFRRLDVADHVDEHLHRYVQFHQNAGCSTLERVDSTGLQGCGFTRRLALSCLVDADHGDTARHSGNEVEMSVAEPRWTERAEALQRYVDRLPQGQAGRERDRNALRQRLYETCRDADVEPRIRSCDAAVGSGKTTAVMAHLLRVAAERKPPLRHIFVVLPYTNIITQAVEVYRKALVLDGERPEDVVAEHHHQADFADIELRQLATLWKAPIIVTTAVQFFETIASHHPARLRKLHELPGSAVFVDEAHAAIPSHLWPQMWRWLDTWIREWGGHLVLASGSLPRFWKLDEYREMICTGSPRPIAEVPDLVPQQLREELHKAEGHRIHYARRPKDETALDCEGLIDFVMHKPGPRLLIVNTVQTAAVVAQAMRDNGLDVLHLSTALAPAHRDLIVQRVKLRLAAKIQDWTLVATSCVEAGMDFSFRSGFRERASTASLIQIGGRVNRGNKDDDADVWDLLLMMDGMFRPNPAMEVSRRALHGFDEGELNVLPAAELATRAMKREWTCGAEEKARSVIKAEEDMEYPQVAELCRIIQTDTRMIIIDPSLSEAVRKHRKVCRVEILRYSVQLWSNRIEKLDLPALTEAKDHPSLALYGWPYAYDPGFLGYMQGVLKLEEFIASDAAII